MNITLTPAEKARFLEKADLSKGHGPDGDCWLWQGALDHSGYAKGITIRGVSMRPTHVALMMAGKVRVKGKPLALHSCDNKQCVNPDHLRWGDDADNAEDHRQRGQRGPHWLSDETVHEIHRSSETNTAIARRLNITPSAVCNIRKGRCHKHIYGQYYPLQAE